MARLLICIALLQVLCPVRASADDGAGGRRSHLKYGTDNSQAAAAGVPGAAEEFLDAHNEARAEVGVGPLKWSENLEKATARVVRYQRVNNQCQFANLSRNAGRYGANQLRWGGRMTPRMVVGWWVTEKKYYNHPDNSCAPNHMCGTYTQVVWRNSTELGCAQVDCRGGGGPAAEELVSPSPSSLAVCFYFPPGNVVGESPY